MDSCKATYVLIKRTPQDFAAMEVARSNPFSAHVVLHAKPPRDHKYRNRQGACARSSNSRENAQRELEPWLLIASPSLNLSARQLVKLYTRQMQIECPFSISNHVATVTPSKIASPAKARASKFCCRSADWLPLPYGWSACVRGERHRSTTHTVSIDTAAVLCHAAGKRWSYDGCRSRSVVLSNRYVNPPRPCAISLAFQHENVGKPQTLTPVLPASAAGRPTLAQQKSLAGLDRP